MSAAPKMLPTATPPMAPRERLSGVGGKRAGVPVGAGVCVGIGVEVEVGRVV